MGTKKRLAEIAESYEVPSVELLEVEVEIGFSASLSGITDPLDEEDGNWLE